MGLHLGVTSRAEAAAEWMLPKQFLKFDFTINSAPKV